MTLRRPEDVLVRGIALSSRLESHVRWLSEESSEESVDERLDLTDQDLRGVDLRGEDLRCVTARGADLSGSDFTGADMRHSDLAESNLSRAILDRVLASQANFRRAKLCFASARNADFGYSAFDKSDLRGADLNKANTVGATFLPDSVMGVISSDPNTRCMLEEDAQFKLAETAMVKYEVRIEYPWHGIEDDVEIVKVREDEDAHELCKEVLEIMIYNRLSTSIEKVEDD